MRKAGRIGFVCRKNYSETETYERLHFVYYNGSTYVAKKTTIGNTPEEDNEYWHIFAKGGDLQETSDVSNTVVKKIVQFGGRVNIKENDRLSDIAGKIKKWFSDMKTVAFTGKYTDLEGRVTITNNDLATISGTAWDAVRGAQIRKDLDCCPSN